ncbi:hypothetical protein [Allostreptomyces psammosilenae]|uniref:Uncharacterized protein n=1 Tax=Allostreptomyces psammosilenae TaxID=1892865 RepID=A0A852ZZG5_9ACTN|nr:hypothetical protein [Allostreptomyces psammosilenae]NYI06084.1 hypothetical protein [Allostreptomyces psammosilenae]
MALRIFDTDPEAKPTRKANAAPERPDIAFSFRTGMQVGRKPVSLAKWRVVTGDPVVAESIGELLGGQPEEYDPTKKEHLHVLTDASSVEIVVDGSSAIEDKLILWGRTGPLHECDGEFFLSPVEDKGKPCGCPPLLADRKELARSGRGPSPSINIRFRLAGPGYELGVGRLIVTAWTFIETLHEVKEALDQVDGEALCRLEIEHVKYTKKDGTKVEYRKPVVTVLGSYNDAIADDPVYDA